MTKAGNRIQVKVATFFFMVPVSLVEIFPQSARRVHFPGRLAPSRVGESLARARSPHATLIGCVLRPSWICNR